MDFRNVVMTLNNLPKNHEQSFSCIVNDQDEIRAARMLIIVLIAVRYPAAEAAEMILHLWYSAHLPSGMTARLQSRVKPYITRALQSFEGKADNSVGNTKSTYKRTEVTFSFTKKQWQIALRLARSAHKASVA